MKLVILTGLSGSGKSIALHTLEDLDYYCIDNLPASLLPAFAEEMAASGAEAYRRAAVAIDVRNQPANLQNVPAIVSKLAGHDIQCQIVFMEAEHETLIKRFSETRRKHPLTSRGLPLADALQLEQTLLEPLLQEADLRIDSTHTNVHELRDMVRERLSGEPGQSLSLLFESFGFKHGLPGDADFVFDVRNLPNPHWKPGLRPLTGRDPEVIHFLETDDSVQRMFNDIRNFLAHWLPSMQADNRSYLTVAIGCTGGQHRSVYIVERLAEHFRNTGISTLTRHRELP